MQRHCSGRGPVCRFRLHGVAPAQIHRWVCTHHVGSTTPLHSGALQSPQDFSVSLIQACQDMKPTAQPVDDPQQRHRAWNSERKWRESTGDPGRTLPRRLLMASSGDYISQEAQLWFLRNLVMILLSGERPSASELVLIQIEET